MKNINFLTRKTKSISIKFLTFLILLILTHASSFAQNPPAPPLIFIYPFSDNFNNYLETDPLQFQSIWSGGDNGLGAYLNHGLNGTMDLSINFVPSINSDAIRGAFGPFTSDSELRLSYRFVEYSGQILINSYALTSNDYLSIDFLSYPDSVSTNIALINSSNHLESIEFQQINISLASLAGDSGFVSFNFHGTDALEHWIDVDDIFISDGTVMTGLAREVTKQNNYSVFVDSEHQINLINNNHQKTTFSIYDLNGRLLISDSFNSKHSLNTENWPTGMYFIKMQDELGEQVQKIIL